MCAAHMRPCTPSRHWQRLHTALFAPFHPPSPPLPIVRAFGLAPTPPALRYALPRTRAPTPLNLKSAKVAEIPRHAAALPRCRRRRTPPHHAIASHAPRLRAPRPAPPPPPPPPTCALHRVHARRSAARRRRLRGVTLARAASIPCGGGFPCGLYRQPKCAPERARTRFSETWAGPEKTKSWRGSDSTTCGIYYAKERRFALGRV